MASQSNIYSLFWISKTIILNIQNNYFGYPKLTLIVDIEKYFLDIQNNYFGYLETGINVNSACHTYSRERCKYCGYLKHLFLISKISIADIQI